MKVIGYLIEKAYLTPAQGRAIEAFIIGTGVSLLVWVLDNVEILIDWGDVDWRLFFVTFAATTSKAIVMGIKKHLRDMKA